VVALEVLELLKECVELGVGDLWCGIDVVALFVVADLSTKFCYTGERIHGTKSRELLRN